jgi:cell division inhibitor SepF
MGLGDLWNNALVYFGIAEEEEDWDDEAYATHEDMERTYAERPNVRRLTPRGRARQQSYEDWTDEEPAAEQRPSRQSRRASLEAVPSIGGGGGGSPQRVHLVVPRSFNDAQQIADKFKEGMPVILNLQGSDADLSKRLIDFTSGLTYALNGGMQRVADKVFLLTPRNVEVSAEERARLLERGGFYNQA